MFFGFAAGYFSHDLITRPDYPILTQAISIVEKNGLKPMPAEPALQYGMIQGMLQAYGDPYTVFIAPPQNELQTEQLQGSYGGIGVRLGKDAQGFTVIYPLPGSTALSSGVKDGDRLLAIETNVITPDTSMDDIQAAIRGPVGQKVTITVGRPPDYTPTTMSIQRSEISLPSVTWRRVPGRRDTAR